MEDEETRGILIFFSIMVLYIILEPLIGLFSESRTLGLILKLVIIGGLLIYFKKWFKFKLKFDALAILVGLLIGILWVGLDTFYSPLIHSEIYIFSVLEIFLKLGTGILIAPVIEEFFTRFFLHRVLQGKKWLLFPMGKFSWIPFIITTLFFGLAHSQWLVGLLAGALLNLLWYKRKDMNSVVVAHGTANLVLWVFVVTFQLWHFWG